MASELRYRFAWQLSASPDALWPYVADTNRFNRDVGGPRVDQLGVGGDGEGIRRLRLTGRRRSVLFEEAPFEWVRPERFGVVRRYASGPFAEIRAQLELTPRDGGSTLVYQVWVRPRGLTGRLVAPVAIGRTLRRRFGEAFRRYDRLASGAAPDTPAPRRDRELAPGGRERLARLSEQLVAGGDDVALVDGLARTIEEGDELDLARLRPYRLAAEWGAERRVVLELCLRATRLGLLESRWEVICPMCRGSAASSEHLAGLSHNTHCESCSVSFSASFDRQVELTFRPSQAVREIPYVDYCVGGPGVTPHVVVQQLLEAGEQRTVELALEPGTYRLRARAVPGTRALTVGAGGAAAAEAALGAGGWPEDELLLHPRASVTFVNRSGERHIVLAERTAWLDEAASAADVTALQAFRDLFAAEALRPGEEMSVGSLTIVFTDLRDSTRLYRQIGDAPAFGSVSSHFDVLREAISREDGAIVKTIGDAVMAVFRRPVSALRAAHAAQRDLAAGAAGRPLQLKVGIHTGSCIAVTLNDRLDYFGSTVNAAARIVGLSSGDDLVISEAVRSDPEVAELAVEDQLGLEPVEAQLKGFDEERFALWRVRGHG